MKVSLNTIKQYIDFELPPVDELVRRINEQLGGVEEVIDLRDKYKDAVIVKVVEAEKHPNADRLNVTKIDDGGVVADVPRDENGYVQVVCGAPNVHADMFAVWLPPKATVPASNDDAEPFVLDARELRGVMSQGMLAAADELAIGSDHDGILEINPDEWKPSDVEIKPGASFAKAYGLDDTIIDIENKMFTHRPDLFGQLGVAREIAGIFGQKFTSPSWYVELEEAKWKMEDGDKLPLDVFNDANKNVPRVMFVAMQNVEIRPSPLWLQTALIAMGSKSINNVVDVTNYVMLLTAQPTHAYDYDKIRGARIGARMAKDGEKIHLLNGKTYELTSDDIVIADAEGPVGLGGIMGGGDSEVDENTKNIILEVATFDMYAVRKSAMRHGVFTDALTRFNKGQSPLQNGHILGLLMLSMKDVSNAEQASQVFDLQNLEVERRKMAVDTTPAFINERLGLDLNNEDIVRSLDNVEIDIQSDSTSQILVAKPPFWRTDLELPEDIVEEVGRLYGFDKLPRELPQRSIKPAAENPRLVSKRLIRDTLSRAGANEVLTYSFLHEKILTQAGQNPEKAYRLGNALSPDLQYYRLSLTPSLLDKVNMNFRAGFDEFAIFELGKTHYKGKMDTEDENVPNEDSQLAFIISYGDKKKPNGAAYYQAKNYLAQVTKLDAIELQSLETFDPASDEWGANLVAPYEPKRAAVIVRDGQICGVVGEFKQNVKKAFKLPEYCAGFEIRLELVKNRENGYRPLSKYPSVTQDISLRVADTVSYASVRSAAQKVVDDLELSVELSLLGIYQAEGSTEKTITLRARITSYAGTLQESDASAVMQQIAEAAKNQTGAVQV